MAMITYGTLVAWWDKEELSWKSNEPEFENLLDSTIPKEVADVQTAFLIGGAEKMAAKAAMANLGPSAVLSKMSKGDTAPDEEEGVDF